MQSKLRGLLINLSPNHSGVVDKDEFIKALNMAGFDLIRPFLSQKDMSTIRTLIYQDDPSLEENILYEAHLERVFSDESKFIKINCINKSDEPFPAIRDRDIELETDKTDKTNETDEIGEVHEIKDNRPLKEVIKEMNRQITQAGGLLKVSWSNVPGSKTKGLA